MPWTDARIALLARLWAEGVSASGIADQLGGVSRSAVLGKLHRLKLLRSRQPASAPQRYAAASSARPVGPSSAAGEDRDEVASAALGPAMRVTWREEVFAPLPGMAARHWLSRQARQCAFPVEGEGEHVLSCCAPTTGRSAYCAAHRRIVFRPERRDEDARRWIAAVEQWAA